MGGRVVGVVGVAPSTPNFILLLVILIYTSPPNSGFNLSHTYLGLSEHSPRHINSYFTLSYPNLHFPTNFHPNQTKIDKVCYWGGFWVGW